MSRPATHPLAFFRLTKVNAHTGEFRAEVANERVDGAHESCDVVASLPHFDALEARSLRESGGKKVAPLRRMHQLDPVGNVVQFEKDAAGRTVAMLGKVTSAEALREMAEGVLCGVSMGGSKRYTGYDAASGARRYVAIPKEISLVDLGEIPGTGIEMLNAAGGFDVEQDGAVARRLFTDRPMAQAAGGEKDPDKPYGDVAYAKPAAGGEPAAYPLDTPSRIRSAWSYAHKYKESSAVLRRIIAAWKAQIDSAGPPAALEKAIVGSVLAKTAGFDLVARTAQIVGELSYLAECQEAEEAKEGDAAAEALCAQYARAIRALGDCLVAMTAEEVDELGDEPDDAPGEMLAMANAAAALRGLRGRLQRMHNMSVELGAACAPPMEKATTTAATAAEEDGMTEQELQKAVGAAVEAALGLKAEATGESVLQKAIGAALGTALDCGNAESPLAKAIGGAITPKLAALEKAIGDKQDALSARLKAIEDQPEAAKGVLLALDRGSEAELAKAAREESALKELADADPVRYVAFMQRQPGAGFRVTTEGVGPLPRA